MALFEFTEYIPEKLLACFYAHERVLTRWEGPLRTPAGYHRLNQLILCKSLGWLSVIIRLRQLHQSTAKTPHSRAFQCNTQINLDKVILT